MENGEVKDYDKEQTERAIRYNRQKISGENKRWKEVKVENNTQERKGKRDPPSKKPSST